MRKLKMYLSSWDTQTEQRAGVKIALSHNKEIHQKQLSVLFCFQDFEGKLEEKDYITFFSPA